jgi:hypothetical protein
MLNASSIQERKYSEMRKKWLISQLARVLLEASAPRVLEKCTNAMTYKRGKLSPI